MKRNTDFFHKIDSFLLTGALLICLLIAGCSTTQSETGDAPSILAEASGASVAGEATSEAEFSGDVLDPSAETTIAEEDSATEDRTSDSDTFSYADIPEYSASASVTVHANIPYFTEQELTTDVFETYASLDSLGRCGVAYANLCQELMPTTERGAIGQIKPSGWHTVKYAGIDGNYLYNRCHLIGYQLAGENANEKNLITGTRYMNTQGMLPYEDEVADYIDRTDQHVLYRVTPIFLEDELVCRGVLMEAYSVEDEGAGICFCVFCYNVQPGVTINYATGDSEGPEYTGASSDTNSSTAATDTSTKKEQAESCTYILNANTGKFHLPTCSSVNQMAEHNKIYFDGTRDEVLAKGYEPCGRCNP